MVQWRLTTNFWEICCQEEDGQGVSGRADRFQVMETQNQEAGEEEEVEAGSPVASAVVCSNL